MASSPSSHASGSALLPALGWAGFGGVLDFVAFPGIGVWPLAFVCFVPLFHALLTTHDRQPRRLRDVATIGAFYGFVSNVGGFYWLVEMLQNFSGFSTPLCILFAGVVCAYQGGMVALFAMIVGFGARRGWPLMVVAPAALCSAEWLWPRLFPYYHGAHLTAVPWLLQSAELGGPLLLTALVVVVNVGVYAVLRRLRTPPRSLSKEALVAAFVAAVALAYGAVRTSQVEAWMAQSPQRSVGIVQVSMGIFDKRRDPVEGLRRHVLDSLALLSETPVDLLIWPESAFTWFVPEGTRNVKNLVLGPIDTALLFGGLRRTRGGRDGAPADARSGRLYNTAFLTDELGNIVGTYDKTFLMPFGETLPFGDVFPVLYEWSPNTGRFTPGTSLAPLPWGPFRVSALICYEDVVPSFTREAVTVGKPHLLVSIANDAWFGDSTEPWQHHALALIRAVEHRRFMVRSTNSGVSAIVDATGRVTAVSGVLTRETLHGDVRLMEGWTAYQLVGDWPGPASTLVVVVLLMAAWRRRGSARPPEG